jgi:hypothetical protein
MSTIEAILLCALAYLAGVHAARFCEDYVRGRSVSDFDSATVALCLGAVVWRLWESAS